MTFQVGDIVRLKNGDAPQRVTTLERGGRICTQYLRTRHTQYYRPARDFVLYETENPMEDQMPNQNTLYQTKEEKPRYGNYIATNPEGRVVLAMDTGYEDFPADQIEEVVPHTILIQFSSGKEAHYQIPAGKLEVGDLIVRGNQLGRVNKVNTKNRNAHPEPNNLRKVSTVKV